MFRNYIENRERFFHGRDNNRKSLPFEWGIEHVGLQATEDPEIPLRNFVSSALQDSPSFYACRPTERYDFDGHVLKFPSAIETPYPKTIPSGDDSLQRQRPGASFCRNGMRSGMRR